MKIKNTYEYQFPSYALCALLNKQLILITSLLLATSCNSHHKLTDHHPIDTCPSDEGLSCPLDNSPCPFCGRTLNR